MTNSAQCALCTTVVYNTAQNSSDNLSSYPPDNHHSSDNCLQKGEGTRKELITEHNHCQ